MAYVIWQISCQIKKAFDSSPQREEEIDFVRQVIVSLHEQVDHYFNSNNSTIRIAQSRQSPGEPERLDQCFHTLTVEGFLGRHTQLSYGPDFVKAPVQDNDYGLPLIMSAYVASTSSGKRGVSAYLEYLTIGRIIISRLRSSRGLWSKDLITAGGIESVIELLFQHFELGGAADPFSERQFMKNVTNGEGRSLTVVHPFGDVLLPTDPLVLVASAVVVYTLKNDQADEPLDDLARRWLVKSDLDWVLSSERKTSLIDSLSARF